MQLAALSLAISCIRDLCLSQAHYKTTHSFQYIMVPLLPSIPSNNCLLSPFVTIQLILSAYFFDSCINYPVYYVSFRINYCFILRAYFLYVWQSSKWQPHLHFKTFKSYIYYSCCIWHLLQLLVTFNYLAHFQCVCKIIS